MKRMSFCCLAIVCCLAGCVSDSAISPQHAIALAKDQMPDGQVAGPVVQLKLAREVNVPGVSPGYTIPLVSPQGVKKVFFVSADGNSVKDITKEEEQRQSGFRSPPVTPERAALAKAAREQAARIGSIDVSRLHNELYTLLEDGSPGARVVQLLGKTKYPVGLQAENANAILVVPDMRTIPAPRDVLLAIYEQPSQGREDHCFMLVNVPAARDQYLLVDREYVVYPRGVIDVAKQGPFLKLSVQVKNGGAPFPGADVTLVRGEDVKKATSDAQGCAAFELSNVGREKLSISISRTGHAKEWRSGLQTYFRGARPGVVWYSVTADVEPANPGK